MCVNGDNMEELTDRKEKLTTTSNRRNNKPLMEKRRRQRINECLNQLKSLVLQAMNKDSTQYSKLEKADILEMTVKHLKLIQRQQMSVAMANDPNVISKYRAGFNECAAEISRYLDSVNQSNPELKSRIMNYLANSMMQFPVIPVYQTMASMTSPYQFQVSPQVPVHPSFVHQFHQDSVPGVPKASFTHREDNKYVADVSARIPQSADSLRLPVNSEPTSRVSSSPSRHIPSPTRYVPSPTRYVPSPCDSDSGLSDSSLSITHDENGNYSQFNINHGRNSTVIKTESSGRLQAVDLQHELDYSQDDKRSSLLKRSHDFNDQRAPPKRQRTPETAYRQDPSNFIPQVHMSESMWRPW